MLSTQNGPSSRSSIAREPLKVSRTRPRYSVSMSARLFFPRRLDPVRDRRPGDKDAVVPPQVPTGGPIWEAVLDDQSHGGLFDPQGVTGLGQVPVGHVGADARPAR